MNPYLSVIIPCYNEEGRIGETLLSLEKYFSARKFSYEILFVNDGSTDGTEGVIRKHAHNFKNTIIITLPRNSGKGRAVREGMLRARGEIRLFMDADNSADISNVELAEKSLKSGAEAVVGRRERETFFRKIGNAAVRAFGLYAAQDAHCGFKAFSARAAEDIFGRAEIDGWGFDVELFVIARELGLRVDAMPVRWHDAPGGHVTFGGYLRAFFDLAFIRINIASGKYGNG